MSEYTPDTEQVRDGFAEGWFDESMPDAKSMQVHREAFDRWLAEVVREAKEEAWDDGVSDFQQAHGRDNTEPWPYLRDNPYRRNKGENE